MFGYNVNSAIVVALSLNDIPPVVILVGATGISVAALASLIALSFHNDRKSRTLASSTPIPPHRSRTTLPLVGDTWDAISMGQSTFMTSKIRDECMRANGEPLLIRLLGQPDMLVLSDPHAVEEVLKTHFDNFERNVYETFFELTGDSLFGIDGDAWQVQRRVFAKLFTPHMLRGSSEDGDDGVMPIIHRHATMLHRLLLLRACPNDGMNNFNATTSVVNLSALLSDFTVEVVTEIGFGVTMGNLGSSLDGSNYTKCELDDADDDLQAFTRAIEDVQAVMIRRFGLPAWLWKLQRMLSVGVERSLLCDLDRVDRVVMRLIDRSLNATLTNTSTRSTNLVSVYMDEIRAMSEVNDAGALKLLRDIAIGFLVAGRDSTAQTLSWVLYCIARHPQVEEQVVNELRQHWKGFEDQHAAPFLPSEEQLQQFVYMEATVRETMRLYPIVAFNMRSCVTDTHLSDGTFVPAGTRVGLPTFAMGRMPKLWGSDANEFKPERWLEQDPGGVLRLKHVSTFLFPVFHAGPRVCMGRHLAMLEIKTAAAAVLSSFRLVAWPENHQAKYVASLTQPMEQPLRVCVVPRCGIKSGETEPHPSAST
jgi:cytochrome P450